MNPATSPTSPTKPARSPRRIVLIVLASLMGFLILLDLSPVGGNYRMYAAWVRCGQKPLMGSSFMGVNDYNTPPVYDPIRLDNREFFCSPADAEAAGYEASPFYKVEEP